MHANIGPLPNTVAPIAKPRERLISIPYLFLRATTAVCAFATGFVQTFVFARVLSPERFSIFIVIGAIGYTLWVTDLGLAKIVFVNLRAPHLENKPKEFAARQATAVILFYVALALVASLVCFAVVLAQPSATPRGAAELALFLFYVAFNLVWFSLRSISISVDLFVFYESLELVRRVVNMTTMLVMLAGLPFFAFLILTNVLWSALFTAASVKLIQRGALVPRLIGVPRDLLSFFELNWHSIARSGTGALSGVFVSNFPYYIVPAVFGLGAAPIILEVTFRTFRGACAIFAAVCDLAIPGQTRALAGRDAKRMMRTTLLVVALCCIPAAIGCGLLIFAGGPLFTFLLRTAATVPPVLAPILVVLLIAGVVQTVSDALLQYSGFFRSLAYSGAAVMIMMILMTAVALVAKLDLMEFLTGYAAIYAMGAIFTAILAIRGPIHATTANPQQHAMSGLVRMSRARQAPSA